MIFLGSIKVEHWFNQKNLICCQYHYIDTPLFLYISRSQCRNSGGALGTAVLPSAKYLLIFNEHKKDYFSSFSYFNFNSAVKIFLHIYFVPCCRRMFLWVHFVKSKSVHKNWLQLYCQNISTYLFCSLLQKNVTVCPLC